MKGRKRDITRESKDGIYGGGCILTKPRKRATFNASNRDSV